MLLSQNIDLQAIGVSEIKIPDNPLKFKNTLILSYSFSIFNLCIRLCTYITYVEITFLLFLLFGNDNYPP
jgi:hypothetical protein